jgi:hypothetical protein
MTTEPEGVAGAAYSSQNGFINLNQLPDISRQSDTDAKREYARLTFVAERLLDERLHQGRPCARSFLAIRVEVGGRPWGVLMIDSRQEKLPEPLKASNSFRNLAKMLEILLERAK